MPEMSIRSEGLARRIFIAAINVWPPASSLASGALQHRLGFGERLRALVVERVGDHAAFSAAVIRLDASSIAETMFT